MSFNFGSNSPFGSASSFGAVTSIPSNPTTLFVGDLSVHCAERELCQLFCQFGQIEFVQIKRESGRSEHLSYGFVKFLTRSSAELALQEMNGYELYGRKLRVGWAAYKASNPFVKDAPKDTTAQIHCTFMTHGSKVVTEETLKTVFSRFGEVKDVVIKKLVTNQKAKTVTGYGFIHYPLTNDGINAAKFASWAMKETTVDNIIYRCSVSHGLQQIIDGTSSAPSSNASSASSNIVSSSLQSTGSGSSSYNIYQNISPMSGSPNSSSASSPVNSPQLKPFGLPAAPGLGPSNSLGSSTFDMQIIPPPIIPTKSTSFYGLEQRKESFCPIVIDEFSSSANDFGGLFSNNNSNKSSPMFRNQVGTPSVSSQMASRTNSWMSSGNNLSNHNIMNSPRQYQSSHHQQQSSSNVSAPLRQAMQNLDALFNFDESLSSDVAMYVIA